MIRITIELLPLGSEIGKRHLGTAEIVNDGTGTAIISNYDVRLSKWGAPKSTWKKTRVVGFNRRKRGPWDLFYVALRNAIGSRNV